MATVKYVRKPPLATRMQAVRKQAQKTLHMQPTKAVPRKGKKS
ncbi:MAG TPA: hypothetical protein VEL72_01295 [Ktedonobacteraceae bacterium]|nr:hypothetical protein [Ktedonobacteraceae bacterium]